MATPYAVDAVTTDSTKGTEIAERFVRERKSASLAYMITRREAVVSETPETDALFKACSPESAFALFEMRNHARKLERERDLLRRQVELLAKELSRDAVCDGCICGQTCHKTTRAVTCGDSIKQWSLEQAKNGGGGE